MNTPRASADDYINFLIATPFSYSCLEAGRVQPDGGKKPAHDAFNRLLHRLEPDPQTLWEESAPQVALNKGVLIADDSTLDKPYATKMELVTRHWSGKHRAVVEGINLITLLWADGDRYIPCDYRIYDHAHDGLTKNDHFVAMVQAAHKRGFAPEHVLFDSWYSGLDNLKLVRELGWVFCTRLKSNRQVNPDDTGNRAIKDCNISAQGTIVHLKGFGLIKVFRIVTPHSDTEATPAGATTDDAAESKVEYWATNDLEMNELTRLRLSENAFAIENYHRGLKQHCGVEKGQMRLATAQRNHIGLAIRAFLRLEINCFHKGISWHEAKISIVRDAVRTYLANPFYTLSTA